MKTQVKNYLISNHTNMKNLKTIITLFILVLIASCSKDSDETAAAATPLLAITAINPATGPKNTPVTISGTGFSTTPGNNAVTLNGKVCPVVNSTAIQLTITIPPSAGSGKIKVAVAGANAESGNFEFVVTTTAKILAGSGNPGNSDGFGTSAQFRGPTGLTVDVDGNIFIADMFNDRIRKITPAGNVSTVAGSTFGFADGQGFAAKFHRPSGISVDPTGNLYITDYFNNKIRKISSTGLVSTFAGNIEGFLDGIGTSALFNRPGYITIDNQSNFYVTDSENRRVRKISAAGVVTTVAGSGASVAIDGQGTAASFSTILGLTIDPTGNLFVIDDNGAKIRKISPAGLMTTFAGSTTRGFADGQGAAARFAAVDIVSDAQGNLFVADDENGKIRKITPSGLVSTVAGRGTTIPFLNDNGTSTQFNSPNAIAIDANGNIYVSSFANHQIGKITFD